MLLRLRRMGMSRASVNFTLRQDVICIGVGDVRPACGEAALHWMQKIDRAKPPNDWCKLGQQFCGVLVCDNDRDAGGGAFEFFNCGKPLVRWFGATLFPNVKQAAAGIEYRKTFIHVSGLREH